MLLWLLNIKMLIKHVFLRAISTHVYLKPKWQMYKGVNLKLYALFVIPLKPRYPYLPK